MAKISRDQDVELLRGRKNSAPACWTSARTRGNSASRRRTDGDTHYGDFTIEARRERSPELEARGEHSDRTVGRRVATGDAPSRGRPRGNCRPPADHPPGQPTALNLGWRLEYPSGGSPRLPHRAGTVPNAIASRRTEKRRRIGGEFRWHSAYRTLTRQRPTDRKPQ